MAYSVIDKVYTIFIDVMTGSSNGYGKPTFYNTDSHTSFIELTVTNGSKEFNMTEFSYMFTVEKPDGTKYTNEYTTQDKSKLVIPVDAQMISCTGNCNAQLYVNKEVDGVNKTLTMVEFNYTVYKGLHEGLISESIDFDNVYVKILNKLDYIINNGADLTDEQAQQLSDAYRHSQSPHAPANVLETVDTKIGEAKKYADDAISNYHHSMINGMTDNTISSFKIASGTVINPSLKGLTREVSLKGRTYQNLAGTMLLNSHSPSNAYRCESIPRGVKYIKGNKDASWGYMGCYINTSMLKKGATYTVVFDFDSSVDLGNRNFKVLIQNMNSKGFLGETSYRAMTKGRHKATLTLTSSTDMVIDKQIVYISLMDDWMTEGEWVQISNLMLFEGDLTSEEIPEYVNEIQGAGYKCRNLLELKPEYFVGNSVGVLEDNVITVNYTSPFEVWLNKNNPIAVEAGHLTISFNNKTTGASGVGFKITEYGATSNILFQTQVGGTFAIPRNMNIAIYLIRSGDSGGAIISNLQLEQGVITSPYEPYFKDVKYGYRSCGKNYWGKDMIRVQNDSSKAKISEQEGSFTLSTEMYADGFYVPVKLEKGKIYTFSANVVSGVVPTNVRFFPKGNLTNHIASLTPSTEDSSFKLTFTANTTVDAIARLWINQGECVLSNVYVGEEGLSYEAFQGNTKEITVSPEIFNGLGDGCLNGINNVQDSIVEKADGIYFIQRIGKKVYDGSPDEDLAVQDGGAAGTSFYDNAILCPSHCKNILCNRLWASDTVKRGTNCIIVFDSGRINFYIPQGVIADSSIEGIRAWLAKNPLTVYYEMAKPKEYKLLDRQSTNILLYADRSYVSPLGEFPPILELSVNHNIITLNPKQYYLVDGNKNIHFPDVSTLPEMSAVDIKLFMYINNDKAVIRFPSDVLWGEVATLAKGDLVLYELSCLKYNDTVKWACCSRKFEARPDSN